MKPDDLEACTWYVHHNGNRYFTLALALMEADRSPVVVYTDENHETVWVRPRSEFLAKFKREYPKAKSA